MHIHVGLLIKSRVCVCTHFHAQKSAYMWESLFFGSVVFRPMVLVLGIMSEVLNQGTGSLVLVLNGFGPWY